MVLWPDLAPLYAAWLQLGAPCSVAGGGMSLPHVVDHRATLYPARRAWLDEEGITDADARQMALHLLSVLDEEHLAITREAVARAVES